MKQTYDEAMAQVYRDEGGYTNDPRDPGGPTNFGITIHDARAYWKSDATAQDVKNMPKSVAADIYRKHYANAINYDELPPGVDYAVLDYGINSGISRALHVYQTVKLGTSDPAQQIDRIYEERLAFLQSLSTWKTFGRGWGARCESGRILAHRLYNKYKTTPVIVPAKSVAPAITVASGAAIAASHPSHWPWILGGVIVVSLALWLAIHLYEGKKKS